MKHFLKLTWTIEERGKRFFVSEATSGGDNDANGTVLIGPFDVREACEVIIAHRRREMGEFMKKVRQQIEASKVVVQRAVESEAA